MEWADKLKGLMPEEYLEVRIYITGENRRGFRFSAHGKEYADIIRRYIKQQI
jgi:tRNA A37 threonylcarbamoyladenosine biosynthesis protein TsaE